ncbi:hypothetical protein SAMN05660748_2830 [Blastococcus aggregatus]|uniref:Uncharacterized protein n=1 Tax=Blastococcus aggregatus TaxID=38502 RepID=A0A285VC63_9ACTN|nr:hypothetical protein [Blastococcus aggregatus]SOC50091.1 hypothetical protein SAMN05660748_2830 [Blastococcus aggregatus]
MPPLVAPPAHPSVAEGLVPLSCVDDLHDADLDLLLADRLAESAVALRAVVNSIAQRL